MQLTPAQVGMSQMLGDRWVSLCRPDERPLGEIIQSGREFLVACVGLDLGYDAAAWHDHLCATNAGGYRWSNYHLDYARQIARVLADPAWREAVAVLTAGDTANTDPEPQ